MMCGWEPTPLCSRACISATVRSSPPGPWSAATLPPSLSLAAFRLVELRWWDYDLGAVRDVIDYSDLERAAAMLEAMKARGELQRVDDRFVPFQQQVAQSRVKWAAGRLRVALQGLRA